MTHFARLLLSRAAPRWATRPPVRPAATVCWSLVAMALAALLVVGCTRGAPGADSTGDEDGGVGAVDANHRGDATLPPDVGCAPQVAYEDPNVDCDGCSECEDLIPYRWTGRRCAFEPICCACAGPDCGARYRTFGDCQAARDQCPRDLMEVEYPDAKLIWQAPGGVVGYGPALMIDGYGELRSWDLAFDSADWDLEDPDYEESFGLEAANELFGLLAEVDFSSLPHDPQYYAECYPSLWLQLEVCPGCPTIQLSYASGVDLRPELEAVYLWLAERLCRPDGVPGYPQVLPAGYCVFNW